MGTVYIVEGRSGDDLFNEANQADPVVGKTVLKKTAGTDEPEANRAAPTNRLAQSASPDAYRATEAAGLGQKLGSLWDRFGRKLVLYARQWCRSPDDVVQETFFKLAQLSPWPNDPATWLYTAVRHRAIDVGESERVRTKNETSAARVRERWFEQDYGSDLANEELMAAFETLDLHHREVVVLRLWSEFTFDEIASITNQSESTVQRHYAAAIRELQKKMGK